MQENLANDEPVKEFLHGGQMLFNRLRVLRLGFPLHPGRNMHGLNLGQAVDPFFMQPAKKLAHGSGIGFAGIAVADLSGEEFEEPPEGLRSSVLDEGGHRKGFHVFRQLASL